ncbi:MAG: hypothetical protein J3Q66DRAFT_370738 [Benniella sp.]|nr:MAG: hypothetical protein J3Q66DRAFT_370738 [Benniella sp.]
MISAPQQPLTRLKACGVPRVSSDASVWKSFIKAIDFSALEKLYFYADHSYFDLEPLESLVDCFENINAPLPLRVLDLSRDRGDSVKAPVDNRVLRGTMPEPMRSRHHNRTGDVTGAWYFLTQPKRPKFEPVAYVESRALKTPKAAEKNCHEWSSWMKDLSSSKVPTIQELAKAAQPLVTSDVDNYFKGRVVAKRSLEGLKGMVLGTWRFRQGVNIISKRFLRSGLDPSGGRGNGRMAESMGHFWRPKRSGCWIEDVLIEAARELVGRSNTKSIPSSFTHRTRSQKCP